MFLIKKLSLRSEKVGDFFRFIEYIERCNRLAIFGVVIISYELGTDQSNNEEFLTYLLEIRPHWRDEIGNFAIFGTANPTGRGGVHLLALVCAVGGNFLFCAIFMFLIRRRLLAQRATLSERTFRMHRALTIALTTQVRRNKNLLPSGFYFGYSAIDCEYLKFECFI